MNGGITFNGSLFDQKSRVLALRDVDDLSVSLIGVRVKFNDLIGGVSIVVIVDSFTVSNFSFNSFPSVDTSVFEDKLVSSSNIWRFESSVDNEVGRVIDGVQFNVIDGETETITER